MSTSLPPLSSLSAKPPQNPSSSSSFPSQTQTQTQPPTSPSTSSSNYATTLAARTKVPSQQPTPLDLSTSKDGTSEPPPTHESGSGGEESKGEAEKVVSPTSPSWRPSFDRHQSWSEQDRKRVMHEGLVSPAVEKGGFSSAETEGR
ncbi:hypothetical protein MMC10_005069 [Thelotrema lepadinum]|nr:hypothetical protein [Thelotrema lepadinum]